jgi:predicted  nucleic acid-binding Zn-ribbon protein
MADIDIPGVGKIQLDDKAQWATEMTQEKVLKELRDMQGKTTSLSKSISSNRKPLDKTLEQLTEKEQKRLERLTNTVDAFKNVVGGLSSVIKGLADTMAANNRRLSDANGLFRGVTETLGPLITTASTVTGAAAGPMGAGVGLVIGKILEGTLTAINNIQEPIREVMDNQIMALMPLTKAGFDATTEIDKLQVSVLRNRLNLDEFTAGVLQSRDGLLALGGGLDRGANLFMNTIGELVTGNNFALEKLGLGVEDVIANFDAVLETNKRTGIFRDQDLTKTTTALIKNYRILGEITGATIDEQREAAMEQARDTRFNARLIQLVNEGREDEAIALKKYVDAMSLISEDAGNTAKERASEFGTAVTAATNLFTSFIDPNNEIGAAVNAILSGQTNDEFIQSLVAGQTQLFTKAMQDDTMLSAAQLGFTGENNPFIQLANNMVGDFAQFMDRDLITELGMAQENTKDITENLSNYNQQLITTNAEFDRTLKLTKGFVIETADSASVFDAALKTIDDISINLAQIGDPDRSLAMKALDAGGLVVDTMFGTIKNLVIENTKGAGDSVKGFLNKYLLGEKTQLDITPKQMGGGLFPGMTALIGEAGPELISMGQSFGEVMNSKDTQNLMGNMKSMMDGIMPALQSGDMGSVISQMEGMAPELESSMKTMSGQIQSKVNETGAVDRLESTMNKATSEFQKESMNYAAQNQQTLVKIEKLLKDILPKAMSGNGYF